MKKYEICILGGGASGSICAIQLAKSGHDVCVIDGNDFPSKKLLVTGNGRCNLTNKNMSSLYYNQNIDKYLKQFSYNDTIKMFNDFGLETYFDEEGRCYPLSNSAKTVCFVIKKQFEKYNIPFIQNQKIISISKDDGYYIQTENEEFYSKYIIIATGHNEEILKLLLQNISLFNKNDSDMQLNDKKVELFIPSLVALKTKESTKKFSGQRLSNVKVSCKIGDRVFTELGEVLFKDEGLSGICIFNLSMMLAQNGFEGKVFIDIFPDITLDNLIQKITQKLDIFDNIFEVLQCFMSKELAFDIINRTDIESNCSTKNVSESQISKLANIIKNYEFNVTGHYDNNQVCLGGINLECLTDNLESKNNPHLYFCGEICDVAGLCGGYNLQWAFASAYIVANDIIQNNK